MALCRQTVPLNGFEVIVVDDGCPVALAQRLASFDSGLSLRLVRIERQGPAAARNAGAAMAGGRILVFLDDDCVPNPGWLGAYLSAFQQAPDSALVGPVRNGLPRNVYAEAYHVVLRHLYEFHLPNTGQPEGPTRLPFFPSANFAVSRNAFQALGGFEPFFSLTSEDRVFSAKWWRSGHGALTVPPAEVHHLHALTLHRYLVQQFQYGRGGMQFRRWLQWTMSQRTGMERFRFYARLLLRTWSDGPLTRRPALFLLVMLSQVALALGHAREALTKPRRQCS